MYIGSSDVIILEGFPEGLDVFWPHQFRQRLAYQPRLVYIAEFKHVAFGHQPVAQVGTPHSHWLAVYANYFFSFYRDEFFGLGGGAKNASKCQKKNKYDRLFHNRNNWFW